MYMLCFYIVASKLTAISSVVSFLCNMIKYKGDCISQHSESSLIAKYSFMLMLLANITRISASC